MQRSFRRKRRRVRRTSTTPRSCKLSFETLEDRCLLATVAVSNTLDLANGDTSSISALLADDGADGISLREAILAANATPGKDFIDFNIPTSDSGFNALTGVWTIQPSMPLPIIDDAVEINGYSQSGASRNSLVDGIDAVLTIELDGDSAGFGAVGLEITAGGSTVSGLVINRFSNFAIFLKGSGNSFIEGNFLGTDPGGTVGVGSRAGVSIEDSVENTIGGSSPAARNLISGNFGTGVEIGNAASTGNRIQGNFIGTDFSGLNPLGNNLDGVLLTGVIGQDTYASDNFVGGTEEGEGNLISGNGRNGVQIIRGTFNLAGGLCEVRNCRIVRQFT